MRRRVARSSSHDRRGRGAAAFAQRPTIGNAVRQFVKVNAPVVAMTHVRVIDGTGAPARENQTLVIRDGLIAAVGPDVADSRRRDA